MEEHNLTDLVDNYTVELFSWASYKVSSEEVAKDLVQDTLSSFFNDDQEWKKEKMQLKMHKMMCKACTLYEEQSFIIEKGIELYFKERLETMDVEDLKLTIKLSLQHMCTRISSQYIH